jgi:hypothetical protein
MSALVPDFGERRARDGALLDEYASAFARIICETDSHAMNEAARARLAADLCLRALYGVADFDQALRLFHGSAEH